MANSPAVLTPNLSPAYNNEAFALLGLIFYRATGKTYGELIHSEIVEPLNMTNTGVSPGNTSRGVIPTDNSFWGADFGLNAPQGGLYSSTNDLCKFASAILNHTILPSDSVTRAWLKPTGMLPQVRGLVGRPWEIYRTSGLTKRYPHTVDVYAKDGGIPGYLSRFALVDEYGIGIVALTAGPKAVLDSVTETAMSLLVEAADDEARKQAQVYVGNYSTTTADVGHVEVQMGIDIDDGPGLRVMNLTRNGSDILEAIRTPALSSPGTPAFRARPSDSIAAFPLLLPLTVRPKIVYRAGSRCVRQRSARIILTGRSPYNGGTCPKHAIRLRRLLAKSDTSHPGMSIVDTYLQSEEGRRLTCCL